jgi:septal ring factor EnvC (AmiA/AmiB activator)
MFERARLSRLGALTILLLLPTPAPAQGTPDLEESRRRLEEIRAERDRLQRQRERLQGQVHDVNDELSNLERQRESTQRIVTEIERQIGGLASQLDRSSAELILAQDNLAERRAVLQRRLVDIYKRGTLHTFQVLLAAESFGDLLSRYKYLYLTSEQDRSLVTDVEKLRNRVVQQRNNILNVRGELDRRREEREAEASKYSALASERASKLQSLQRSARNTERRLTELQKDESRLNGLLASLERARRDEAARGALRGGVSAPGSITTADLGKLDWPVEGTIVYRFGRDTLPSGGVIRWNGVGIAAPVGTPVKAVESGKVRLVGQFGTYGLTIVLEHGNGYYSVYAHLETADVKLGASASKGGVIGTVGGQNSDYGPHLHFEIRGDKQIALDPTMWLRRK